MNKVYVVWEELFDAFGNYCAKDLVRVFDSEESAIRFQDSNPNSSYYHTLCWVYS